MHLDEPGDGLALRRGEAKPRAKVARDPRPDNRMVFDAALGDVVQEQRNVKKVAVPRLNGPHQFGREFGILGSAGLDVGKRTDADRKSTRLNSSHPSISYAVFCLKKKTKK